MKCLMKCLINLHFVKLPLLVGALVASSLLVGVSSTASASTVNLNFGFAGQSTSQEYTGLGVAPDAGGNTFWTLADENNLNQSNLTASDGVTPTTIGFSLNGHTNDAPYNTATTGISLYQLGFRNNVDGGNGTLTINGLDNSKTYDFYAYAQGNHTNPNIDFRGGTFAIGGTSQSAEPSPPGNHSTFEEGVNYVKFSGVSPISSEITVTISNVDPQGGVNAWIVNAFQVQEVNPIPEPSTIALGIAGLLAPCAIRVRRRR